jgi:hypothetical protein
MRPLALAAFVLIAASAAGFASEPGVGVKVEPAANGKTTYRFSLDRAAAEQFRDAVVAADAKKANDVLSGLTKDPTQKAVIGLATSNVEAFKRAMTKDGAIGANGVDILVTVTDTVGEPEPLIPGRNIEGKRGPIRDFIRKAGRQVGEAVLNPWAWEVKPRD